MAKLNDILQKLNPGFPVKLKTDEGDFEGVFKQIEDGLDVELFKCQHLGKALPGVQSFAFSSIESITISDIDTNKDDVNIKDLKKCETTPSNNNGTPYNVVPQNGNLRDRPVICKSRNNNYADVSHLSDLHPLRMPELINQIQMEDPAQLLANKKIPGAFEIPQPEQDPEHIESDKFKNRHSLVFTAVRNQTWKDLNVPPQLHCPTKLAIIRGPKDVMFSKALKHLNKTRTVGVSLEGQFLGRHGKLSLISFATPEKIYMVDVVKFGDCCFDMGLRKILEDSDIQKVFHDVRQPSDILYHRYNVKLKNVDDTLVTHTLFTCQSIYAGYLPKYAVSVSNLARAYLGIKGSHLYFPHYRQQNLKADTEIWMERPMKEYTIVNALRNVMYLLELRYFTKKAYCSFHRNAVDILLSHVRDGDSTSADVAVYDNDLLPQDYICQLPNLLPNEKIARNHIGITERRFVHQAVQQVDPNVIFSRDVMHQSRKKLIGHR